MSDPRAIVLLGLAGLAVGAELRRGRGSSLKALKTPPVGQFQTFYAEDKSRRAAYALRLPPRDRWSSTRTSFDDVPVYYRIDNGFGEGVANIVIGKATGTVWMWFEGRSEDHQAVLTEEVPEGLRLCVVAAERFFERHERGRSGSGLKAVTRKESGADRLLFSRIDGQRRIEMDEVMRRVRGRAIAHFRPIPKSVYLLSAKILDDDMAFRIRTGSERWPSEKEVASAYGVPWVVYLDQGDDEFESLYAVPATESQGSPLRSVVQPVPPYGLVGEIVHGLGLNEEVIVRWPNGATSGWWVRKSEFREAYELFGGEGADESMYWPPGLGTKVVISPEEDRVLPYTLWRARNKLGSKLKSLVPLAQENIPGMFVTQREILIARRWIEGEAEAGRKRCGYCGFEVDDSRDSCANCGGSWIGALAEGWGERQHDRTLLDRMQASMAGQGSPLRRLGSKLKSLPAAPRRGLRKVKEVAKEICAAWDNVHYAAKPYLDAMLEIDDVRDNFEQESGKSIVRYFLANASSFRGPHAKRLKAELKELLGGKAQ